VSRTPDPHRTPVIAREELRSRLAAGDPIWLVHVPAGTFGRGHLLGAVAFGDLARVCHSLRPQDTVVVYGPDAGCTVSRDLVEQLRRQGYVDSWWFADGLRGWVAAGGEVEAQRPAIAEGARPPEMGTGQPEDGPMQAG
jgi:rhodanese-related sulfurtransferase